jgi:hypothetical protein
MKLPALLLAVSVAANVLVLGAFALRPALAPPAIRDYFKSERQRTAELTADDLAFRSEAARLSKAAAARANAQRTRLWATLDSADLATLIAHLRAAGFSPSLIRVIVGARIEAGFRSQMTELLAPLADTPFWKPQSLNSFYNNSKAGEAYQQILRDRTKLMRQLLGDDFFAGTGTDPTDAQRRRFGDISKAKMDLVQRVADDYTEMSSQVKSAMQGITLPEDREKLALLEREKHADLAAILTPEELDAYEMRNSIITSRITQAMTFMDASEAEFQTIYHALQPVADILFPQGNTYYNQDMMRQRTDAQAQVATQLTAALGADRYADYARASDYEYQQIARLGQRDGLSSATVLDAYNLRDTTAGQSMAIFKSDQSPADKATALAALADATKAQLVSLLGPAAATYVQNASWLNAIRNGYAIETRPNGQGTVYHSLPPPKK